MQFMHNRNMCVYTYLRVLVYFFEIYLAFQV